MAELIELQFGMVDGVGRLRESCMHISATWQIRTNDCVRTAAAMSGSAAGVVATRPVAGLLWAVLLLSQDWPCADDLLAFTAHLRDLDDRLPLPDYTRTSGALHLVSHIPEYFVRPELSVLRLLAGQSSTVCGQVAPLTKLKLDVVDSATAVVYVSEKDESHKHGRRRYSDLYNYPALFKSSAHTGASLKA